MSLSTLFASTILNRTNSGVLISGNFGSSSYQNGGTGYTGITALSGGTYTGPSVAAYSLDGSTKFGVNTAVGPTDISNTTNWPDFYSGNNNRTGGQADPFGGTSATKLMPTSANSPGHYLIYQNTSLSSTSTTFSVYVKAAGLGFLAISGYAYNYVNFNLTTGAITDGASGLSGFTAVNVGNGWWRCSATGSGTWGGLVQLGAAPDASNAAFTGNGTDGILVCAPQFESGTAASPYSSTTGQAAPRITSAGLLVEAAATNIIPNSDDFSVWTQNSAVTIASATAPDGTSTAKTVTNTVTGGNSTIYQSASITSGQVYTYSFYIKQGNTSKVFFGSQLYSGYTNNLFDFSTNTFTLDVQTTAVYTAYSNGWYRIAATTTANWAGPGAIVYFSAVDSNAVGANNTTSGQYHTFWRAQCELGTTASSGIQTTGAAVTRTADVATQTYTGTLNNVRVTTAGLGNMVYPAAGVTNLYGHNLEPTGTLVAGPTGAINATSLTSNSYYQWGSAASIVSSATYTISYYVKSFGLQYLQCPFNPGDVAGSAYANFDIINGTVTATSGCTAVITPAANGYFRVAVTYAYAGPTTGQQVYLWTIATGTTGFAGAGPASSQTFAFYGIQIEAGTVANGLVPSNTTTSATLTTSSPFNFAQAPFLGQNIQTFGIFGTSSSTTGAGSVTGTSSVAGASQTTKTAAGSVTGTSSVAGASQTAITGAGSVTGTTAVAGGGAMVYTTVGNVGGTVSVAGVGSTGSGSVGTVNGTSSVAGTSQTLKTTAGTVNGTSSVSAQGATGGTAGLDNGTSSVAGTAQTLFPAAGTVNGTSSVAGTAQSLFPAAGTVNGTASVAGASQLAVTGAGTVNGTASVAGASQTTYTSVGTVNGTTTVAGASQTTYTFSGTVNGTVTISGAGATILTSAGTVNGTTTVAGVGATTLSSTGAGTVNGTSTVSGAAATSSNASVSVTGVVGVCTVSSVNVWGAIPETQVPGWTPVNESQTVTWNLVDDSNTAVWTAVPH